MINNLKRHSLLFLFLLLTIAIQAQDLRTVDTQVADLLVQMPANDLTYHNQLMEQMWNLGGEVHKKTGSLIIPPGTGNDTQARFAIESLSKYLSAPGKEAQKAEWEQTVLQFIRESTHQEVQAFFIRQLEFVGSEQCLPLLNSLLTREAVAAPAIKSMSLANLPKAATLFEPMIPKVTESTQVMLITALGQTAENRYAASLAALYPEASLLVKKAILKALSNMVSPVAEDLLLQEAQRTGYHPDPNQATYALLDYCRNLSATQPATSAKLAQSVLKKSTSSMVRTQALLLYSQLASPARRDKVLLAALKEADNNYRGAALLEAIRVQSPADSWVDALGKTKKPAIQQEVIYLLRQMNDPATAPAIIPFMNSQDAGVRAEAAVTYAVLAKEKALPELMNFLSAHSLSSDQQAAHEALMLVVSKENIPETFTLFQNAPVPAQRVLMDVWGEKKQPEAFDLIIKTANNNDKQLRATAFSNLKQVTAPAHLPELLTLFNTLTHPEEIALTGDAIASAAVQSPDKRAAWEQVQEAAAKMSDPERYIPVYSRIGDPQAVKAVYHRYLHTRSATALEALINWNDHHAAQALHTLCSDPAIPDNEKSRIFLGYVRMVGRADLPDDQKLLLMRKIMPLASAPREKTAVLNNLSSVKTFPAFVFVSKYLDDPALQNEAANTCARIAMPDPGQANGLSGQLVVDQLSKARNLVTGPDSQYLKIDIDNFLASLPPDAGFVSLFNGNDLTGWQGFVDNPVNKQNLTPKQLQNLQKEANIKMSENWSVQNGSIVFNGKGDNLCTLKEYGDFEMIVDWRITKDGDSGIYLRGTPQVQIWDTARVEVGAQVGSGGLYNNQKHESKPLLVADNPIGDWNSFRIRMVGERVTVHLNGHLVTDNVVMENYWNRNLPIFPSGPIELQAHGTDLAFRDIYVREINSSEFNLSEEEKSEGFQALFNGSDLSGWIGNKTDYQVDNGVIVIRPQQGGHGNLFTEKEYGDFIFRFEFKLTPGANNGLGIRAPLEGDAAYVGMELQILDDTAPVYANLEPYQYHGSVYGVIAAKQGYLKPVGQWNQQEVIVKGTRVTIILNGTTIVDGDIAEASKNGTLDQKEHPGLKRNRGHIGFLGHGSEVFFRNIRIKEIR